MTFKQKKTDTFKNRIDFLTDWNRTCQLCFHFIRFELCRLLSSIGMGDIGYV